MIEEILDFIKRRFSKDCNWTTGNCFWFAIILQHRFPELEIWYLPIRGHFVVKIPQENTYIDWTGILTLEEEPQSLFDIQKEDELWYRRLIRDCFM